jgi:hypothetical protein
MGKGKRGGTLSGKICIYKGVEAGDMKWLYLGDIK